MVFIPLPEISNKNRDKLRNIYLSSNRTEIYEDKNIARSTQVFIDIREHQDWIYNTLVCPLGIERSHIRNNWPDSRCCGINFNVFKKGDWCHPHRDVNPVKINFLFQGRQNTSIFFPDDNVSWDYSSPAMLNVSKKHMVTQLESLINDRITLQIFLVEKIGYYAKVMEGNSNALFNKKSI